MKKASAGKSTMNEPVSEVNRPITPRSTARTAEAHNVAMMVPTMPVISRRRSDVSVSMACAAFQKVVPGSRQPALARRRLRQISAATALPYTAVAAGTRSIRQLRPGLRCGYATAAATDDHLAAVRSASPAPPECRRAHQSSLAAG